MKRAWIIVMLLAVVAGVGAGKWVWWKAEKKAIAEDEAIAKRSEDAQQFAKQTREKTEKLKADWDVIIEDLKVQNKKLDQRP